MTPLKFATLPVKYAPKRKMIDFSMPQWKNKIGEFDHPDLVSWVNSTYQSKVYKTQKEFNDAYDQAASLGMRPSDAVCWRNKPMVLNKEDIDNFEEEFNEGAFDEVKVSVQKTLTKMRAALETGEKVLVVY